ncbi:MULTISPECIES: hypothetical protein [unclassified Saccharothrix]|uniref:hypothetical protein n=1 Tax=unclassified Saccharothrix TaxID=2593673 RepID=UPI00307F4EDB
MRGRTVGLLVVSLLVTGCLDRRYEPLPDSPGVGAAELEGRWESPDTGAVLVLNGDGSAEATGVECFGDGGGPVTGVGRWRVEANEGPRPGQWPLGGDLVVVVDAGCAQPYGVAGTEEEFRLYYYRGDFDARDAYVLER